MSRKSFSCLRLLGYHLVQGTLSEVMTRYSASNWIQVMVLNCSENVYFCKL